MCVKFGIIGFGFIGQIHEEKITNRLDGAKLAAICDIVPERMDETITPDVLKFTSADDLLAVEEIDVVLVAVPNHLHKEMVIKAAHAGKDIICEKPAALTVAEFDEMMDVVKHCGVQFTVHQQRRFDKDLRTIKNAYDNKLIGKPYTIQSKLYGYNGNMHDWHVYKKYGGGMLYDWGVHLIDQIMWMMGCPVKSVYADVRNVINFEVDDYFKILMRFENGVMAEIELGTYFLKDEAEWFTRHWFLGGDKGTVYCDGFSPEHGKLTKARWLLTSVPGSITMTKNGPTRSFGKPQENLLETTELQPAKTEYLDYYRNYLAARTGCEDYLVKPEEVRNVLRVMEAVRESSETGRSIILSD